MMAVAAVEEVVAEEDRVGSVAEEEEEGLRFRWSEELRCRWMEELRCRWMEGLRCRWMVGLRCRWMVGLRCRWMVGLRSRWMEGLQSRWSGWWCLDCRNRPQCHSIHRVSSIDLLGTCHSRHT